MYNSSTVVNYFSFETLYKELSGVKAVLQLVKLLYPPLLVSLITKGNYFISGSYMLLSTLELLIEIGIRLGMSYV